MNTIIAAFIPVVSHHVYNNHSHSSWDCGPLIALAVVFSIMYLFYMLETLIGRDMSNRSERLFIKREFILDLIIPFRGWFIWLKGLFKDKE